MRRRKKLIIAILLVILFGLLTLIAGTLFIGPDLTQGKMNVLVLAADKYEQPNGGVDMAFVVHLENGSLINYTPVYPGGMSHPTKSAPGNIGGKMMMHDCLWDGTSGGMQNAKEIVEANTNLSVDAVVIIYDEGLDNIINSVRPFYVDGEECNLSAADIVRENDGYNGYPGSGSANGNMSRGDAVMVLVKALSNATKDPNKKSTMIQAAMDQYSKGNIIMTPEGAFARLLATKGFDKLF